jgi:hypothetical protein
MLKQSCNRHVDSCGRPNDERPTAPAQTIRVQTREDGFSIDQVVLSSVTYLTSSPGALKNDTTILTRTQ